MKRMMFAVLLAVFICCSLTVITAELLWEKSIGDRVPENLKQQSGYDELQWKLVRWYNLNLKSDWQEPGFAASYRDILNLHEGAMGYISVPSKGIQLPISHGYGSEGSVGHIQFTDFPIGSGGTHCALTGDFSLDAGDCFYIHLLGQVRPYRIAETITVSEDGLAFPVEEGQELCTLVNADPNGTVYLMRGSYWEEAPEEGTIRVEERMESDGWLVAACIVFALGILLVPMLMWCRGN